MQGRVHEGARRVGHRSGLSGFAVHHFFNNHWAIPQSGPWNEVEGNDVYRPMPPQDKAKEATANLFIGEPDNIVMEYVEA